MQNDIFYQLECQIAAVAGALHRDICIANVFSLIYTQIASIIEFPGQTLDLHLLPHVNRRLPVSASKALSFR